MTTIKSFMESISGTNRIFVNSEKSTMENSAVTFRGTGNILYVEDGVVLADSKIDFFGDNGLMYISQNRYKVYVEVMISANCTIFLGNNNYFNTRLSIIVGERENVLIGNNGLFSHGISIRTADPHLLYSVRTRERINYSKSVLIGDHVWIGQQVLIIKGTQIGSGAIVGGGAVVPGKKIPSNTSWGGNPARLLKEDVFFTGGCVNAWDEEMTRSKSRYEPDDFIYHKPAFHVKSLEEINNNLKEHKTAEDRLKCIQELLVKVEDKNRFYISGE